ncbi:uncharacterized protein LOC125012412 isoform X2 [Mugil cephalus]|uniref:uncharacterized protein LOC125012412 isoform X2 n=1 Tax=Mugil cephalus TaxID=48193 RepID=UPI001FB615D4|nr:uncharacterized protein LOC125012412 isoform X2 [Mugil cephalus]
MTGRSIKESGMQMKGCMSTAIREGTLHPNTLMTTHRSLCFHQDLGPQATSSFTPETLNVWVYKGSCCTLQQRPSSGRATQRVRQQNKEEGDGRSTLLSCLNVRLENRAKPPPRTRFRTGSRPEMTPSSGALTVNHCRKAVTETHTTSCDYKNQARHGQSGAPKVSQLHLYLPSSLCEDEEQDSETQEMRISAD